MARKKEQEEQKENKKKKKNEKNKKNKKKINKTDEEILQLLKNEIAGQIEKGTISLKVSEFLKILEIQKKLSTDSGATEKFWAYIEKLRQQELSDE